MRIDRIEELMTLLHMSQSGLAREAGCTQGTIQQILDGTTRRSRMLPEIAKALETTVEYLTDQTDEPRGRTSARGMRTGENDPASTSTRDDVARWLEVRDHLETARPEWTDDRLDAAATSIVRLAERR